MDNRLNQKSMQTLADPKQPYKMSKNGNTNLLKDTVHTLKAIWNNLKTKMLDLHALQIGIM